MISVDRLSVLQSQYFTISVSYYLSILLSQCPTVSLDLHPSDVTLRVFYLNRLAHLTLEP
jgi:hypothetical protein